MSRVPIHLPGKQSKYRNKRSNGFDSKREERRYQELLLLEKAGKISNLLCQERHPILVNNVHICTYISDFCYWEVGDPPVQVHEDCKGYRTREYRIKKKLMKAIYGIEIRES